MMNSFLKTNFTKTLLLVTALICLQALVTARCNVHAIREEANRIASLPDAELFRLATTSSAQGCRITRGGASATCDLYVKTPRKGIHNGWPLTPDGRGTGCVKAPYFPKQLRSCPYTNPPYSLTTAQITAFCTNNGKSNALAQLRDALNNLRCHPCIYCQIC